jgi:2-dehydropantoate 2-reductase
VGAELVLVATKRGANAAVRATLEQHCPTAPVLLLQNGLDAAADLGSSLRAFQCVVAMNVVSDHPNGPGVFTRTSPRPKLTVDAGVEFASPGTVRRLVAAAFAVSAEPPRAFAAVQRGKLLVNLFNAPNALSGLPTAHTLLDRSCLALFAATAQEAVACFDAAGHGPNAYRSVN